MAASYIEIMSENTGITDLEKGKSSWKFSIIKDIFGNTGLD